MPVSLVLLAMLVAVIVLIIAEKLEHSVLQAVSKLSASTLFLVLGFGFAQGQSTYGVAVVSALGLCWIGDACLLSKKDGVFMAGIAAFLLGHVGFAVAFVVRGVDWTWVAGGGLGVGLFAIAIGVWLVPKVEANFKIPVIAYIVVITAMASLAFGCYGNEQAWLIPAGAVAFFLSDITVALDRFVEQKWVNRLIGLPLYYGAQVLLAASLRF